MPFVVKLVVANLVIIAASQLGKRFPAMAGLIATMPITTLIVMIWLAGDNPGNSRLLIDFTRGVVWGILPTILFFCAAWFCLLRGLSLPLSLTISAGIWFLGAVTHQAVLR